MSRVGAGLGFHLMLITQSFDDEFPTQIAANAGMRICFRVAGADRLQGRDRQPGSRATIPASAQGRAYARIQGADPVEFQSARVAGRRADLATSGRQVAIRRQPFSTLRTAWRWPIRSMCPATRSTCTR